MVAMSKPETPPTTPPMITLIWGCSDVVGELTCVVFVPLGPAEVVVMGKLELTLLRFGPIS